METLVVNFYGGPGTGKSTMATSVFSALKWRGINCEYVSEYAKDKTWEESFGVLDDQLYILGKQHFRQFRLKDKVDVIVTDSPLLLSIVYNQQFSGVFHELVLEAYHQFNNMNIFLQRVKPYNPKGRSQSEDQAKILDHNINSMLNKYCIPYTFYEGSEDSIVPIIQDIMARIGRS